VAILRKPDSRAEAKIDEQKALYQLKRSQVDALHVRAGINGVCSLCQ